MKKFLVIITVFILTSKLGGSQNLSNDLKNQLELALTIPKLEFDSFYGFNYYLTINIFDYSEKRMLSGVVSLVHNKIDLDYINPIGIFANGSDTIILDCSNSIEKSTILSLFDAIDFEEESNIKNAIISNCPGLFEANHSMYDGYYYSFFLNDSEMFIKRFRDNELPQIIKQNFCENTLRNRIDSQRFHKKDSVDLDSLFQNIRYRNIIKSQP